MSYFIHQNIVIQFDTHVNSSLLVLSVPSLQMNPLLFAL